MVGVPSNIVIPFFGLTFDGSQAGAESSDLPMTMLVIAQRLSTGTVAEGVPFLATTVSEVATAAGFGSMAHLMASLVFANNKTVPVWFILLDDAATSTAATHAFDITGTATEDGELAVYIKGRRYAVTVSNGDANTAVLSAINDALVADVNELPCTTAVATSTLTATMKNKGIAAGDLDIRFAAAPGEKIPAGLTVSTVTTTAGTVDPDLGDALAVIGAKWFNVIVQPFTDTTNLDTLEEYMETVSDVMEQREGLAIQVKRDTRTNMITFGADTSNRNSKWLATYPGYGRRESTYELAAAIAAYTAVAIQEHAAIPLHRGVLSGITALDTADRWTATERNQLALNAISTLTDEVEVQTEATVTMYLKNSSGVADTAYRQQNKVFTLSTLRYRFKNQILTKYARALLADEADNIGPGLAVMTLSVARAEAIIWFKAAQFDGLVDSSVAALTQFKDGLVVQRIGNERMEWYLPPDLMDQFIVGSGVIAFR